MKPSTGDVYSLCRISPSDPLAFHPTVSPFFTRFDVPFGDTRFASAHDISRRVQTARTVENVEKQEDSLRATTSRKNVAYGKIKQHGKEAQIYVEFHDIILSPNQRRKMKWKAQE